MLETDSNLLIILVNRTNNLELVNKFLFNFTYRSNILKHKIEQTVATGSASPCPAGIVWRGRPAVGQGRPTVLPPGPTEIENGEIIRRDKILVSGLALRGRQ